MSTSSTLPDGALTERLYALICERRFHGAVDLIINLLQRLSYPAEQEQRFALFPVLAYCLYMAEDFELAGEVYSQLFESFPGVEEYQVWHCMERIWPCS